MADGFIVKVFGGPEFAASIERMVLRLDVAAKAIATESALTIERAAKANFEGSHAKGEPHVGGDLPNVVTGTLRRSIRHDPVRRYSYATWGTTVAPTTVYGRRVELGYSGGSGPGHHTTRAFPYFQPAVDAAQPRIQSIAMLRWRQATIGM